MRQTRATFLFRALLGLSAVWLPGAAAGKPAHGISGVDAATGAALQGDGARARAILLATSPETLSPEDRRMRACLIERFAPDAVPARDSRLRGVASGALQAYRSYWQDALSRPGGAASAEDALRRHLQRLLRRPDGASLDALSADLEARLKAEGWWSLQGRTGRLRELMLWRVQDDRVHRVTLPEGPFVTTVMLLRDFASLGWVDYATCGRRGAGGWRREALKKKPRRLFSPRH